MEECMQMCVQQFNMNNKLINKMRLKNVLYKQVFHKFLCNLKWCNTKVVLI